MLETVRETRELVFDLYFNFFFEGEPEWEEIQSKVGFKFGEQPEKLKVFAETYKLIFDNDELMEFFEKCPPSGDRLWAFEVCFGKNGSSIHCIKSKTGKIIRKVWDYL